MTGLCWQTRNKLVQSKDGVRFLSLAGFFKLPIQPCIFVKKNVLHFDEPASLLTGKSPTRVGSSPSRVCSSDFGPFAGFGWVPTQTETDAPGRRYLLPPVSSRPRSVPGAALGNHVTVELLSLLCLPVLCCFFESRQLTVTQKGFFFLNDQRTRMMSSFMGTSF